MEFSPRDPADDKEQSVTVELILQVSRSQDNRLTGVVRQSNLGEVHDFSGTLELMRVFEELVPADAERTVVKPHPANPDRWGEG